VRQGQTWKVVKIELLQGQMDRWVGVRISGVGIGRRKGRLVAVKGWVVGVGLGREGRRGVVEDRTMLAGGTLGRRF
jgi:hypothetical protein